MQSNQYVSLSAEDAFKRAILMSKTRRFFTNRNLLEIETPILSTGTSTDCHLDIFQTNFFPNGVDYPEKGIPYFLQTSPELHMKRLLSDGYPDIFQICKVFRNGERGKRHNPEFTMVEWYRKDFSMMMLIDEVEALCKDILGNLQCVKQSYREWFIQTGAPDPLVSSPETLLSFCKSFDSYVPALSTKSDILNYIMTEFIEPRLPHGTLAFVYNFPSEQAVLATIDSKDSRVSHRFELYYNGIELCNGYEELADPEENYKRMSEENTLRKTCGKPELPVDPNFIEALRKGIPQCSGVALGLDRLIMLALGKSSIDNVLTFPFDIA